MHYENVQIIIMIWDKNLIRMQLSPKNIKYIWEITKDIINLDNGAC